MNMHAQLALYIVTLSQLFTLNHDNKVEGTLNFVIIVKESIDA